MTTVIQLPFPPSTNTLFAGKTRRYISPQYKRWRTAAGWQLQGQRVKPITGKVCISVELRAPDKRERDADNYLKAIQDLLVTHRVITGDGRSVVQRISAEWTAAGVPGALVTISPA